MNDHDSHMTKEFLDYATVNNIKLFTFSSHATHLLQPLDVGVFQSFKHWHAKGVDVAMRCGQTEFNKLDFFALFSTIHAKTMTLKTISHAWEKTGLMPYNPSVVLNQIHAENTRRREITSPFAPKPLLNRTPKGFQEIIDYGKHIDTRINEIDMPSDLRLTLKRYTKESIAIAYSREIVEWDLSRTIAYAEAKRKRQSLPNTVARKHEVVAVDEVRAKKQKQDENEVIKAQRLVDVANAKLLREKAKAEKERLRPWKELFRELKKMITARNKRLDLKERGYVVYNKVTKIK